MNERGDRRTVFDVAPAAIVKIVGAIALVWLVVELWPIVLLIVVAAILAIALEPIVDWLCRHHVPRGVGAMLCVAVLVLIAAAFLTITGSSLVSQAKLLGGRISEIKQTVAAHIPPGLIRNLGGGASSGATAAAGYMVRLTQMLTSAAIVAVLGLILTVYLLVEGRTTYAWLIAYVPPRHRNRVHETACEARVAIRGYVAGNVATSVFAAVFVFTGLVLLKVPAALLLALLAGVADFVPVLGFIVAAVPAILLGLTVSTTVGIAVVGLYALSHTIENYYVAPRVYGNRLRLSNFAVVVAFAVGAELGGVVGALIALPIAAMVPVVERVWLKDYLARDAVATHERIQKRRAS